MPPLLKPLLIPSIITWLVPFLISFAFYDQNGTMVGNYWVFKLTMIVSAVVTVFFAFRRFFRSHTSVNLMQASSIVIAIQVILDFVVLIGFLSMPLTMYLLTVLPVYIVFIPLTLWILQKQT